MANRGYVRRRVIVDWKLQGSLIAHVLLYGGLVLVAIVGGIFAPLAWDLASGRPGAFEEQAIVMLYMHERFWLLAAASACIVGVSAVRLSHRIAGPLVRYKRNLRLLAAGELPPPLRTRDRDYLKEEVACLNAAVAGVAARVGAIRAAHRALQAELDRLLPAAAASRATAEAAAAAARELTAAIAAFATVDPGDERTAPAPAPAAPVAALAAGDGVS